MPWSETEIQRFLTIDFIQRKRLNAPTIWLKSEASTPSPEDSVKPKESLDCNPELWRSEDNEKNLGVRLADGYLELRIKAPDDTWIRCLFEACRSLNVDARAAYGTKGRPISGLILRVEDQATIDRWRDRWPKGFRDKSDHWVEAPFAYSHAPTKTGKVEWAESQPLPGSKFMGGLVVWRPWGKKQAEDAEIGVEDLEPRELAPTNMESICRAIAFATLGYWIQVYLDGLEEWDESLIRTIGGWTARLMREGADINARGKSLEGVCWAPVDDEESARKLLRYVNGGKALGVAFSQADTALERNPVTPIPGWGAIETLFGPQAKIGIRRAFRAGLDLDVIERMSEQYAYDRTTHEYLDRSEILQGLNYAHRHDGLVERHKNEKVFVGKRLLNPFDVYSASSLRLDVEHKEFRPGHAPAAVLRYSPLHGLLNGEDRQPDEYRVLNVFPGFVIKPIAVIDQTIMRPALTMLDRMLGLLTQDNDAQMKWIKQFLAWIPQFPEIKPQVCPILSGGQGIGKSLLGKDLMQSLFGSMAGQATAGALTENKFLITPFLGKLITFIDEVRLESVGAINTIKTLVRSDRMSGEKKFNDQRDYYIPSRLLIASNQPNIGLTPEDAADRAFFFIIAWTAENKRMTDREFQAWALTLKPFYAEFVRALSAVVVRQHLMRYLMDFEVTREELEDLQHSSRDDENVIRSTMSKAREVARAIVADARVHGGNDITSWWSTAALREAIKRVDGPRTKIEPSQVLMEYERAGVIETVRGDLRKFKFRYGTLLEKLGQAHGLPIPNYWDFEPDDFGDNDVLSIEGGRPWRGNRQRTKQQKKPPEPDYDPDAMPDF